MGLLVWGVAASCGCPGSQAPDPGDSSPPAPPELEAERLPMAATPITALSTEQLAHHELLRIERDFGKPQYVIALDAWVTTVVPPQLGDARLWWSRTDKENERSPFGPGTKRHFEIEYDQPAADRWSVHLVSDGKRFTFNIEVDAQGKPHAFADVSAGSERFEHCRATTGVLHARKVLGLPVGIDTLDMACTDDAGTTHQGQVVASRR
jgi:hypothetical protein